MFDSKKYHREYMRKYRENVIKKSPEKLSAVNKTRRKYHHNVLKKNSEWIEKNRERLREYSRKRRQNPELRKLDSQKSMEWAKKNKEHLRTYVKNRWKTNPEVKLKAKSYFLKRKFGLTYEQYMEKRKLQNEKCPICKNEIGVGSTDHNHKTGQLRDILCRFCNLRLGFIENNRNLVKPMLDYLERWERIIQE